MAKKIKQITDTQFKIGIVVIIIPFIGLLYFAVIEDRLRVQEYHGFIEKPIISPNYPLTYKTEFCASKLTDLAHEIHFLERDISSQERVMRNDGALLEEEKTVVQIEQREISNIRAEFENYKSMCDKFGENPTPELCNQFIEEAKRHLELTQENAKSAESKGILERLDISFHDLRQAERIYVNLQAKCEVLNK